MDKRSEGVRRLSLVLGALGTLGWLAFALATIKPRGTVSGDSIVLLGGGAISFAAIWGLVRVLDWIRRGFEKGTGTKQPPAGG